MNNTETKPDSTNFQHNKYTNCIFRNNNRYNQIVEQTNLQLYPKYISEEQIQDGLKNGSLFSGTIKISITSPKLGYIRHPTDSEAADVLIPNHLYINRALDGDRVVAKFLDKEEIIKSRRKAIVVNIKEKVHKRISVGKLGKKYGVTVIHGLDPRMPTIVVDDNNELIARDSDDDEYLYLVEIEEWEDVRFAKGVITERIGKVGEFNSEIRAIILQNGLDPQNNSHNEFCMAAKIVELDLISSEISNRYDLRYECIFTIDPEMSLDLDDAVSCRVLHDGSIEVGVHIADVSYFLQKGSQLDEIIQERATSAYLIGRVLHMLPMNLCMQCSLLPNCDRLAISIVWHVDSTSFEIINQRICRTVIRSCAQLSYKEAEKILDSPERSPDDFVLHGIQNGQKPATVVVALRMLNAFARRLHQKRIKHITLQKGRINVDKEHTPVSYNVEMNTGTHQLIEELMFLANRVVAGRIRNDYPSLVLLRGQRNPDRRIMNNLRHRLEQVDIHLDISSCDAFKRSLNEYLSRADYATSLVLNNIYTWSLPQANYICNDEERNYRHYALNISCYTHFTSPLRRYADITVHRLLIASLQNLPTPGLDEKYIAKVAETCNKMHLRTRRANRDCVNLYLTNYYLKNNVQYSFATVSQVRIDTFDVMLSDTGLILTVYLNKLTEGATFERIYKTIEGSNPEQKQLFGFTIKWPGYNSTSILEEEISLLKTVKVALSRNKYAFKLDANLMRKICSE